MSAPFSTSSLANSLNLRTIAEGVENSNYFLETEKGRFILTLFEKRVNAAELPYFIGLKQHLAGKGQNFADRGNEKLSASCSELDCSPVPRKRRRAQGTNQRPSSRKPA